MAPVTKTAPRPVPVAPKTVKAAPPPPPAPVAKPATTDKMDEQAVAKARTVNSPISIAMAHIDELGNDTATLAAGPIYSALVHEMVASDAGFTPKQLSALADTIAALPEADQRQLATLLAQAATGPNVSPRADVHAERRTLLQALQSGANVDSIGALAQKIRGQPIAGGNALSIQAAQAGTPMPIPSNGNGKDGGLDISRYTNTQLKKLDAVNDRKIDASELEGAQRFADVDDDGRIDAREQRAFDYVVGKDTSVEAARDFVELQGHRVDAPARHLDRELAASEATVKKLDAAHQTLLHEASTQEAAMRAEMSAQNIDWRDDDPAQLKAKLGAAKTDAERNTLEFQYQYALMRQENKAEAAASYGKLEAAKKVRDQTKTEHRTVHALTTEATPKVEKAKVDVARAEVKELTQDMSKLIDAVEDDPKIHDAFNTYAKASAVKNAAADGKLDKSDINMTKVDADLKSTKKVIDAHTAKLEAQATKIAGKLADPKFMARLEALPEAERDEAVTKLHGMIADTKAGDRFFHDHVKPMLNDKSPKKPEIYDQGKLWRHSTKLGMNLMGVWGARIAQQGGKEALKLMDNGLARAIGIRADQMPKLYQAMEIAKKDGDAAAKAFLKADPELKAISGRLNAIGVGVAGATAALAMYDLVKNPSLRNALNAAKSGSEVAEVISRFAKAESGLGKFSKFAGKFGPPLDVVLGGFQAYGAYKRGDVAGTIGGGMQAAGGGVGVAGLLLATASTGVGVPLAVVGGALAVAGSLVSTLWGDSPTEEFLKEHAPEYVK